MSFIGFLNAVLVCLMLLDYYRFCCFRSYRWGFLNFLFNYMEFCMQFIWSFNDFFPIFLFLLLMFNDSNFSMASSLGWVLIPLDFQFLNVTLPFYVLICKKRKSSCFFLWFKYFFEVLIGLHSAALISGYLFFAILIVAEYFLKLFY